MAGRLRHRTDVKLHFVFTSFLTKSPTLKLFSYLRHTAQDQINILAINMLYILVEVVGNVHKCETYIVIIF